MFAVAVYAVAALHLGDGRGRVGRRSERLGVSHRAAKLHPILIPVSP